MQPIPIPVPVQAVVPHLAIDLVRRFGLIMAGLAALVAHRFLRDPHFNSLIRPLWNRITRSARSFERLMSGLAANRAPKPRRTRRHRSTPDTARPAVLPAGHGWLIRALSHEAAAYAGQLEALLAEPGVAELLAAHPAAARILHPLGRMLGLQAFAPKRRVRNRGPEEATPRTPPRRATLPPLHPDDPTYRPSAKWLRGPWPARRRHAYPA